MIDGVPIETSYQAWNELMRCKKSGKKYQVGGPPSRTQEDLVKNLGGNMVKRWVSKTSSLNT